MKAVSHILYPIVPLFYLMWGLSMTDEVREMYQISWWHLRYGIHVMEDSCIHRCQYLMFIGNIYSWICCECETNKCSTNFYGHLDLLFYYHWMLSFLIFCFCTEFENFCFGGWVRASSNLRRVNFQIWAHSQHAPITNHNRDEKYLYYQYCSALNPIKTTEYP